LKLFVFVFIQEEVLVCHFISIHRKYGALQILFCAKLTMSNLGAGSPRTWKLRCLLRGCSPPALPSLGITRQRAPGQQTTSTTTCVQLLASTIMAAARRRS
jgi:hypothetical protein